jgi:hypothetical protein
MTTRVYGNDVRITLFTFLDLQLLAYVCTFGIMSLDYGYDVVFHHQVHGNFKPHIIFTWAILPWLELEVARSDIVN